ncbi:MAG: ABC transporter permease [Phototrophicales bacterium]|nr:ABC transporter permease [Phototrophicales bacterium]
MSKILAIARRNVYTTFKDRNLLLIMLVTPLMLSTIIALAFSDISGGVSPISNIPVAIVNLDNGSEIMGNRVNNGDFILSVFIPSDTTSSSTPPTSDDCAPLVITDSTSTQQMSVSSLVRASRLSDSALARAGVADGTYAAAIIIPENYTQSITYTGPGFAFTPVQIEVYGDANRGVSAGIVRSIVEAINNSILGGSITIATFYEAVIPANPALLMNSDRLNAILSCAFNPAIGNLRVDLQSITGEAPPPFNALVSIGSSIAGFFALFTGSGAATAILEERRNGTLQRMFASPTPRLTILLGLLIGTFALVLVQLVFLFFALTLINSLLQSEFSFIWGTNWIAIIALLFATALSVSGLGILIASISKTAENSNFIGSIVAMFMGVLGGAFFDVSTLPETFQPITRLSVIRWSSEGFTRLSQGNSDIFLNIVWLLILGAILFTLGMVIFNRRQDV